MSTTTNHKPLSKLHRLAQNQGLQIEYQSAFGTVEPATDESLLYIMNSMGMQVRPGMDADAVSEKLTRAHWQELSEPVAVFWEGKPAKIALRLPEANAKAKADIVIKFEDGGSKKFSFNLGSLKPSQKLTLAGPKGAENYVEKVVILKHKFPFGYHQATVKVGSKTSKVTIISSPWKAFNPPMKARSMGVFAPLYALHSEYSWGIGDFSDLQRLVDWAYQSGCDFVGTLPMLAVYSDKPMVEPSPYSPVSRLFWNELYVDPRRAPEWDECTKAQKIATSAAFKAGVKKLQAEKQVDYQGVARLKRKVVEALAEYFFAKKGDQNPEFRAFTKSRPVVDYAEFRAVCDKLNKTWQHWPERLKNGKVQPGDYRASDMHFHLYSQWLCHLQLSEISKSSRNGGRGIYLDFPLSAHAGGYDVWRERDSFAHTATAGCPPDPAHVHGQNWGILPLNPQSIRRNGYRYFRGCLENHMRYAGFLRLDHVMCFYRLFWVPQNRSAKEGVYVRYNTDEFFALLTLESHRNGCTLIGEDLGTVPPEIREAMNQHGILRMYVQQRRLSSDRKQPLSPVPEDCICSLNTHDMPPFAAFWNGLELVDKMKLKYFGRKELKVKQKQRIEARNILAAYLKRIGFLKKPASDLKAVLAAMLKMTAAGPARVMQINMEDLWLEILPQNVPGTWKERPNWKRKFRQSFESFSQNKDFPALFEELVRLRRSKAKEF